jgi:hypothetical protein
MKFDRKTISFIMIMIFGLTGVASALEYTYYTAPISTPEPGTMVLLGIGMLGLAIYGKRRTNKEA